MFVENLKQCRFSRSALVESGLDTEFMEIVEAGPLGRQRGGLEVGPPCSKKSKYRAAELLKMNRLNE